MTIIQLKQEIEKMEREIFTYSLYRNKDVQKLMNLKSKLMDLKEMFLQSSFISSNVEELEDIRFRLMEARIHLEISTKEALGEDALDEIKQLENLCETV
ncbi:hypothetical protein [Parageobacillus sp. G301]|uniref:hypothetical protein n=1 Tax=Parageobacillus sp. G301 TaxID=2998290 RepID=UPI0024974776|nr:hypothetical protein [Parageobacillus sp. G301]GLH64495.1 hypothetical protein PG301_23340 [Parageobacillus sp. G301]